MRSLTSSIQSLNWRFIWISTFLFIGLYLLAFDKPPPLPIPPDQLQGKASQEKGTESAVPTRKKNSWDGRFDDVHVEDPYPVRGEEYDAPFDAVPGRQRPLGEWKERAEKEKALRLGDDKGEKQKGGGDGPKKDGPKAETLKDEKSKYEKPKEDKSKEEKPKEAKLKGENIENENPKTEKLKDEGLKDEKSKGEELDDEELEYEKALDEQFKKYKQDDERLSKIKGNIEGKKPSNDDKTRPSEADTSEENSLEDEKKANIFDTKEGKLMAPIWNALKEAQENGQERKEAGAEMLAVEKMLGIIEDPEVPDDDYIALCLAVKDQADDLPEFFIHHYHHLGIRRFYIMDDRSTPPLSTVKEDWGIPSKYITFDEQDQYPRAGGNSEQMAIYSRCMEKWRSKHVWMGFIDTDEFIEMTSDNETLQEMLHGFQKRSNFGALAINWRMHTSSGHEERQESVRKAYVDCIWDDDENGGVASNNSHVKVIVRTSMANGPVGPHMWTLHRGFTWGEHMDMVNSHAFRNPITRDRIAVHHYAGKSREEYIEKMLRGNAMDDPKGEGFWESLELGLPKVSCPEMAKYDP